LATAAAAASTTPSTAAAATAGPSRLLSALPLVIQPPAYSSVDGYITFIVLVLAGCGDRLRLPSKFVEAMEGQELARTVMQECSAGQPTYEVEVYYDGEGKCYFRDGWPKFFAEYGVKEGWFLLFSRRDGTREFFICIIDGTLGARSFTAWV
jgi:hypothetical protein